MPTWPRAVLFDFDGVIVNSEPLHFRAFQEVLKGEQIELSEEEYYRELIGFDDKNAIRHVFAKHDRPLAPGTFLRVMTKKTEGMMDLIRRRPPHALSGVEEFVRGMWRNYPLAVCSGAVREEIEAMLEGVNLRDCFGTIVAAEDVARGKPDPEGYLLTARLVSEKIKLKEPLKPGDCLVIEDAPAVIASVKRVGFPILAVATSYAASSLGEADWVCESLRPEEVKRKIPELKLGV
jgi:beta-phosphoglucomutase